MAELITESEMALWTQRTVAELQADPFAAEVRSKVGDYLSFLAGHPEWDVSTAPIDVRTIAIWMVRRTYTNPDQETSSTVGPLASRTLDEAALAMALTDSEAATLARYKSEAAGATGGLWTMSIGGAAATLQPTVYLGDDSQVGLATSVDPREWMIPYLDPNDVNNPVVP